MNPPKKALAACRAPSERSKTVRASGPARKAGLPFKNRKNGDLYRDARPQNILTLFTIGTCLTPSPGGASFLLATSAMMCVSDVSCVNNCRRITEHHQRRLVTTHEQYVTSCRLLAELRIITSGERGAHSRDVFLSDETERKK